MLEAPRWTAKPFQRFWHITLPLLGPMIRLSIFFSVVGALQLFDIIVPLTGGGPFDTTHTMVSFLYYSESRGCRVGFGSAAASCCFIICVTFAFGYRQFMPMTDAAPEHQSYGRGCALPAIVAFAASSSASRCFCRSPHGAHGSRPR